MQWKTEAEARESIKNMVTDYYRQFKENKKDFVPGDRIAYASRVYDEKEMCALTDAMLAAFRLNEQSRLRAPVAVIAASLAVLATSAPVTVLDNEPQTYYDTICQSATYNSYGFSLTAAETADILDTTLIRIVSTNDCESEITLHLTLLAPDVVEIEEHAGQSFVWNGVTYTEEGTYTQYFNNRYGCDSTVTLTLTFDGSVDPSFEPDTIPFGEADSLVIYLPNAITPTRNDGLNDYFCLPDAYKPLISSFEISIFNRWGTRVYHATDKNFRWDGRINGKIFFNNVYNYRIDCLDIIGRPYILRGTITVL